MARWSGRSSPQNSGRKPTSTSRSATAASADQISIRCAAPGNGYVYIATFLCCLVPKNNVLNSSQPNTPAARDTRSSEQSYESDPKSKMPSRLAIVLVLAPKRRLVWVVWDTAPTVLKGTSSIVPGLAPLLVARILTERPRMEGIACIIGVLATLQSRCQTDWLPISLPRCSAVVSRSTVR